MAHKKISQRDARSLRKRVEQLERDENQRRLVWVTDYPYGVEVARMELSADHPVRTAIVTARKLGHAVVVGCAGGDTTVRFLALPLAKPAKAERW